MGCTYSSMFMGNRQDEEAANEGLLEIMSDPSHRQSNTKLLLFELSARNVKYGNLSADDFLSEAIIESKNYNHEEDENGVNTSMALLQSVFEYETGSADHMYLSRNVQILARCVFMHLQNVLSNTLVIESLICHTDKRGWNMLHYAVRCVTLNRLQIKQLFGSVPASMLLTSSGDVQGSEGHHVCDAQMCLLLQAVKYFNTDAFRCMLARCTISDFLDARTGNTLLHELAWMARYCKPCFLLAVLDKIEPQDCKALLPRVLNNENKTALDIAQQVAATQANASDDALSAANANKFVLALEYHLLTH